MKSKLIAILLTYAMVIATGCSADVAVDEKGKASEDGIPIEDIADKYGDSVGNDQGEDTTAAEETEDAAKKTLGGKPWIDSDIKSNVTEATVTDPGEDFHLYANKEWIINNEIPDGYSSWSHYAERGLEVKKQCIELLDDDSIEGHDAEVIRTYKDLILDWDARNESGVSEIEDTYRKLIAIKSIDDVNELYEDKDMLGELTTFFDYTAEQGINDPEHYLIAVSSPALLLHDSAEYKNRSEYGDIEYDFGKDVFTYIAGKLEMPEDEAAKCFDDAIDFEAKLAGNIYTSGETMQEDYITKINNEMVIDDLTDHCSNFPIGRILRVSGYYYDGNYLVERPDYFGRLDDLYTDENIDGIRACLIVKYLLKYANSLDKDTYDHVNEARNRYYGTKGTLSDEEMAYNSVSSMLSASMQKVYIARYGSKEDKEKMEELCRMVIDTYREMLNENDWASDEVRENAIKKLDNMGIHAAYPDKFRDTSGIDIKDCSLIEAERRIADYEDEYNRSLIGTKKDKELWADDVSILLCNAFYSAEENTINMMIGMMGEPFYSSDMSTEDLYASIGAFWVGHEISHAFDSDGAQYDEKGNLRNWWTKDDEAEFKKRVRKMDDYLDGIVAFGNEHFIGSNIDTEMVADMTGLQCALKMASKVEGFDYDRFFTKYAQMNTSLNVYSSELSCLKQDPHPLDYSRTNVPVQQFEEFYETYDVKEGDNMYLAPENRLLIW